MTRRTLRICVATVVAALIVAGCKTTEYLYTPPTSKRGQACVDRCVARQESCRSGETERSQAANAQCQREAEVEYNACLRYSADRKKCYQKACFDSANTWQCDTDYRACFQNCGGKIDLIEH